MIDVVHLSIAGEENEGAAAGDLQQFADALGGFGGELRGARIGHIGRHVEHGLALIIEMRRQDGFARVFQAKALADVLEASADSKGSGGQHGAVQFRPQAVAQDGTDVDRRGLQKHVLAPAAPWR